MTQIIEAVYQNGMFKPLNPVSEKFEEGEKVKLVVESKYQEINPIMRLAENFYEGLSEDDINEIERITLDRSNFFGDRKI